MARELLFRLRLMSLFISTPPLPHSPYLSLFPPLSWLSLCVLVLASTSAFVWASFLSQCQLLFWLCDKSRIRSVCVASVIRQLPACQCCSVQPLNLLPTVPATAPPLPSIHAAVRCQNAKILCHSRIIKFKCFRFEAWQRQRQLKDAKSQRLMGKREWGGEWVRQVGMSGGNGGL